MNIKATISTRPTQEHEFSVLSSFTIEIDESSITKPQLAANLMNLEERLIEELVRVEFEEGDD